MGYLHKGYACQYQEEANRNRNVFDFCNTYSVDLNGDRLSDLVKLGYNCAATLATNAFGDDLGQDEYRIFTKEGKYIRTDPTQGTIPINSSTSR